VAGWFEHCNDGNQWQADMNIEMSLQVS
jgi:hypothetical protein